MIFKSKLRDTISEVLTEHEVEDAALAEDLFDRLEQELAEDVFDDEDEGEESPTALGDD